MTAADSVTYVETAATVRSLRLAHTSVEVGHLYMEELGDDDRVRAHFQRVRPWLAAVLADAEGTRVSTCVLLDDYTQRTSTARAAVDRLLRVADECGVRVDYLVRESGCDTTDDGVPVAELVYARLLPEPPPGTNGSRPPVQESGWLCNGERSDDIGSDQAMRAGAWQPPYEFGKRNHSVFLDVELVKTDPETGRKRWSCAFLSAVWQLLRMGMLRHHGEPVIAPTPWEDDAPGPRTGTTSRGSSNSAPTPRRSPPTARSRSSRATTSRSNTPSGSSSATWHWTRRRSTRWSPAARRRACWSRAAPPSA
ncbi:SCO2522 family protein [Actinokineospora soli]|uniref:SCO2522 family protein n=1 Tax=Actinokineospora soli TaxID=1048753 RepID=A0ABW2TN09_9PSEU